jgi:Domain of unknown function DUF11
VTCSLGSLANNGSAAVTIVVVAPKKPGVFTNTASTQAASPPDPNSTNNTSSISVTSVKKPKKPKH